MGCVNSVESAPAAAVVIGKAMTMCDNVDAQTLPQVDGPMPMPSCTSSQCSGGSQPSIAVAAPTDACITAPAPAAQGVAPMLAMNLPGLPIQPAPLYAAPMLPNVMIVPSYSIMPHHVAPLQGFPLPPVAMMQQMSPPQLAPMAPLQAMTAYTMPWQRPATSCLLSSFMPCGVTFAHGSSAFP